MVCVYDNPRTACREVWMDGKVVMFVTSEFIALSVPGWGSIEGFRFPMHEGKFIPGKTFGNPEAIAE